MTEAATLEGQFEANRSHLSSVAYRMLGTRAEAEDAVQETWIKASGTDWESVENVPGWLTTIVSRTCLDMLRSRTSRREDQIDESILLTAQDHAPDPATEIEITESLSTALAIILDELSPVERVAYVLHDMFQVPFDAIARIVDQSSAATRKQASRARRRIAESDTEPDSDYSGHQKIVEAFLAASRHGNLQGLIAMLHPDAVMVADAAAAQMGASTEVRGAEGIADIFSGGARVARFVLVDSVPGLAWMAGKDPRVVFDFTIAEGQVTRIDLVADAESLDGIELEFPTR